MSSSTASSAPAPSNSHAASDQENLRSGTSLANVFAIVSILALSVAIYWDSLDGEFVWDDKWLVSGEGIGGGQSLARCFTEPFLQNYFRPLVSASIFLERLWFGSSPVGYHAVSVLLHALTTGAVIALAWAMFGKPVLALIAGVCFAVQPAQVGATAWIGGMTDGLCSLWLTLFGLSIVNAAKAYGRRRSAYLAAGLAAFIAAIFTKEQAIVAILLIPLAFACWKPNEEATSRTASVWATVPFAVSAAIYLALAPLVALPRASGGEDTLFGWADMVARSIGYYALLLIAPSTELLHTYSAQGIMRSVALVWCGLFVLAGSLALFIQWIRKDRPMAWALAWTAILLIPVVNIVPLPALAVASYRAALSGVMAAIITAAVIGRLADRSRIPIVLPMLLSGLVVWHGTLVVRASSSFRNEPVLFSTMLRHDPWNGQAEYNLACANVRAGNLREAARQLEAILSAGFGSDAWRDSERAAGEFASDPGVRRRISEMLGRVERPESLYAMVLAELGSVYVSLGESSRAEEAYRAGAAIHPDHLECTMGVAWAEWHCGDMPGALRRLDALIARFPNRAEPGEMKARIMREVNVADEPRGR